MACVQKNFILMKIFTANDHDGLPRKILLPPDRDNQVPDIGIIYSKVTQCVIVEISDRIIRGRCNETRSRHVIDLTVIGKTYRINRLKFKAYGVPQFKTVTVKGHIHFSPVK